MNKDLVMDCLKLILITIVAGLCLGAVYGITKEPIAKQQEKAKQEAFAAVFPDAADFKEVDGFSQEAASEVLATAENTIDKHDDDIISAAVEALDGSSTPIGYIFEVTTNDGYGGDIKLTVGIQADGTCNGYSVLEIGETAGLGMNATTDAFKSQYAAKNVETFQVVKDGTGSTDDSKIDAISGATITSKAVTGAMNSCLAYFQTLEGGK